MGGRGGGGGGGGRGGGAARAKQTKSMISAYGRGQSLRQIANSHGVSYATVHNRLTSSGVQLRGRGAQPQR